jgi:DNA-binding transcriptional ArsR family regulator
MVEQSEHLDSLFRALADPTRRAMIRRLAGRDCTVSELAAPFDISLAAVSKHVKVLEKAGLIERTVRGRTHSCQLNRRALADARQWIEHYERFWNDRLDALERALADDPSPRTRSQDHEAP